MNEGVTEGVAFDPHDFSVQCENRDQLTHRALYCTVVLHRYVAAHTRVKLGLKNHPHVLLFDAHAWHAKEMSTACKKWEIDGNSCMWAVPQTHLLEWNLSFYYNYGQLLKKIIQRYWFFTLFTHPSKL